MTSKANISTDIPRRRHRKRFFQAEAARLRASQVAAVLKSGGEIQVSLRWKASGIVITVHRTAADEVVITGTPEPSTVALTPDGPRLAFRCPLCDSVRRDLYLSPATASFRCFTCARLRYSERSGPPPVDRLEAAWVQLGLEIEKLKWISELGEDAEVDDPKEFARYLMGQIKELRAKVEAATPMPAQGL